MAGIRNNNAGLGAFGPQSTVSNGILSGSGHMPILIVLCETAYHVNIETVVSPFDARDPFYFHDIPEQFAF